MEWFQGLIVNHVTMAMGGVILFVSSMLMLYIVVNLAFLAPKDATTEFPIGEVSEDAQETPRIFENWKLWVGIAALLILFAYTIPLIHMIQHAPPGSPVFRTW